ncbi:hypothetical protein PVAP13_9NG702314 [Panicum virgatum]|uniref:protein-serine/threonine phosphatase n=1 Tax=Panicum virgatum TaxID=38727 RepID=A0A8T0N439_PANVG|nr:hypothetical protein PVAP13_9NG702314 [Panicum virgatum]
MPLKKTERSGKTTLYQIILIRRILNGQQSTPTVKLPSPAGRPRRGSDAAGRQDGLLWYKDSGQVVDGKFSMAVVQANNQLEDQSQVESGPLSATDPSLQGTFAGVYDGHEGPETARYINDHLFDHLRSKPLPLLKFMLEIK